MFHFCSCHEQIGKPVWFPCLYICHLNLFLGPIEQIMARHVDVRTTMPCSNPCYNAGHENFRLKGPWTFCKRPLLAVLRAEALKFHTKSISKQPYNCPENTWCSLWKVLRGWCHSICSSFAATKTGEVHLKSSNCLRDNQHVSAVNEDKRTTKLSSGKESMKWQSNTNLSFK